MSKPLPLIDRSGGRAMLPGLLGCVLVWSCCGCAPGERAFSPAAESPPAVAGPPVVQVKGDRAEFDLGTVKPGSRHRVIFAIHNNSPKSLKLVTIRGDCSCIAAAGAPEHIASGQVTRVEAVFDAPNIDGSYGSELLVLTDDPLRKMIHLKVRADIRR